MEAQEITRLPRMTRRSRAAAVLLVGVVVGLLFAPNVGAHEGDASELFESAEVVLVPYAQAPAIILDGTATPGEYGSDGAWTDPSSGFSADMLWDGQSLFIAVSNPADGWVAVGFSTDLEAGMGFAVVAEINATLQGLERVALNVSDDAVLSPVSPPGAGAIEAFNVSRAGSRLSAELRLSANASSWKLNPGELVPTIIAFNSTSAAPPESLAGSNVRFLRSYLFRPQDNPDEIRKLLMGEFSPVPGIAAVAVMGVGIIAIVTTFVPRKEDK